MARPTPRPEEQKELDRLLKDLHRDRRAARKAQKSGGNPERAEFAVKRAWSAIHSHCEQHDVPMPTESADDPFRVEWGWE